ncbi:MAG TPA: PhzF family phenazine biosynthesis protein [Gemmatimonadaceae bacterium]|nr:PhzF family phenazine biosynthesis protein [Gemmatimonadaceae bacterium]
MNVSFYTLDVFTDRAFAGNPLAVITEADGVPEARLAQIAREFNLSETVFVYPPADAAHTARVRIFTPAQELPFAGHPTVGTAVLLATLRGLDDSTGETLITLEEGVGLVPVRVRRGERATFAQLSVVKLPELIAAGPSRGELARALGIAEQDVAQVRPGPAVYSCGVPFLYVELVDRRAVAACRLDGSAWEQLVKLHRLPEEVFVFAADPELPDSDFRARMFAPGIAVPEDPATGSAVASLAGQLHARSRLYDGTHAWRVEQGFEMGRPSILDLECDVKGGEIAAVRVGGNAVIVSRGELLLPD